MFLRDEEVATTVVNALFKGVGLEHYRLGPFVIMANHVHALLLFHIDPKIALKSLKGASAREANRILHRTGEAFWQRESYDHWVRDNQEWRKIAAYIENNPVKAGLVTNAEDYQWSTANERLKKRVDMSVDTARKSACATS